MTDPMPACSAATVAAELTGGSREARPGNSIPLQENH